MSKVHKNAPVLEIRNVSKNFGKIQALKNVSMEVFPGEVVGLLGDNGAGKSTLIKIISGNYQADEGEVYLNGERFKRASPAEAHAAGIETVYQPLRHEIVFQHWRAIAALEDGPEGLLFDHARGPAEHPNTTSNIKSCLIVGVY